ncbi:hypothetical protein FB451DRAFT_1439439 [Mycena latifolia]|nr:hypothetical protein FB451DRAFT_1439439 [Mycena latifolia]
MSPQTSRHETIIPSSTGSELEEALYSNILVAPGTRYHGLLTSNETPLEADLPAVKSMISKVDARLVCLDTEMSGLQNQIQQSEEELASLSSSSARNDTILSQKCLLQDRWKRLEQQCAILASHRVQNSAILSPLRRMPPELLGEIFLWTLPLLCSAYTRAGFDVLRCSPWVLGHISSHWRAVAISTPSLWSLIMIDYSFSSRYPLPMLETQIARARNLNIHFFGDDESDSQPQMETFQWLGQHSSLWKELRVGLTSALWPLLSTLRSRLPSLARLSIEPWDGSDGPAGEGSIDCFHTAPCLVDVIGTLNPSVTLLLPTHQLTRYEFDGPWDMHQTILKLTQNLVEAHIVITSDEEVWSEHGGVIPLLHIQRLYVSEPGALNCLRTPALREIACYSDEDDPDLLLHLETFLVCSACTPRRLCFRGSPDTHVVSEILRKYPSITELTIICYNPTRDPISDAQREAVHTLISQLTVLNPAGSAAVSPQLAAINFGGEAGSFFDYELYLKMLESRWKTEHCALKAAALITDFGPSPNPATFEGLRKDGLDLLLLDQLEGAEVMDGWIYAS